MVELLAPAGSGDSLRAAVNAGADAVYIGGSMFGARAYADNPDEDQLIEGIEYCHLHGRKLYMTVNTLLKEQELRTKLYPFLLPYYEHGVDGLIVQDLGVVRFVREHFPGLEVHASTQMTVTSPEGAKLLKEIGITRVVPARELSLEEIRNIIEETGLEVETFIHGAMCYCYSGQCLFSSMLGGRSGNRGRCAQPCRLPYQLEGEQKKNIPPYLLSMKDMCTLDLIPELLEAGIASLKIEGRMKRPEYTAGVVKVYRKYIDLYLEKGRNGYRVSEDDRRILLDLYNRGGFSDGYYHTGNGRSMMAMERPNHLGTQAAKLLSAGKGKARAKALENLSKSDVLELSTKAETTLTGDVRKGEEFNFAFSGQAPAPGSMIYRTRHDALLQELNRKYVLENSREKIKGDLRIFNGSPAILKLFWKDVTVTVSGMCAEPALTNPAAEDAVRRQMMKTGNTPFVFEQLSVALDGDLFVSVRDLNSLRREGLEQLEAAILARGQRKKPETALNAISGKEDCSRIKTLEADPEKEHIKINILVTTEEQLDAVLAEKAFVPETVYLDSMLFGSIKALDETEASAASMIQRIKEHGSRCFFNCPPVFRKMDRVFLESAPMQRLLVQMDGFLLHTADQLFYIKEFIQERGLDVGLAADSSLYAYNRAAASFWRDCGVSRMTLPAELNVRELLNLDCSDAELEIYGYQPLMQSAQCVQKNTKGCTKKPGVLYLKDRKKTSFPVINRCYVCCNTVLNSVPLKLVGCMDEILRLSPAYVRLSFTIESEKETKQILKQYRTMLAGQTSKGKQSLADGTRGHFKRGVE